jgi:plastocyanin
VYWWVVDDSEKTHGIIGKDMRMADLPSYPDIKASNGATPDHESTPGISRWQVVAGSIGLLVALWVGSDMYDIVTASGPASDPGQHAPEAPAHTDDDEGNTPPIAGAPELAIAANNFTFSVGRIELNAGQPAVNVALTSVDMPHDLVVDEIGFHLVADRGETVVGGLDGPLFGESGTYVAYCSVPGHREAGMELEIVVTAPSGGHP